MTTSICKLSKEFRNNFAPQPHPCVVTPIVDLRNILKVLPESKTITVDIHIILYWNDYEIILSKGIEDTEWVTYNLSNLALSKMKKICIFSPRNWYQLTKDQIDDVWHPELEFNQVVETIMLPIYGTDFKSTLWFNGKSQRMEYYQTIQGPYNHIIFLHSSFT